jgi:hypothetical protein
VREWERRGKRDALHRQLTHKRKAEQRLNRGQQQDWRYIHGPLSRCLVFCRLEQPQHQPQQSRQATTSANHLSLPSCCTYMTLNIFKRAYTALKLLFLIDTSENPCTASCS